MAAVDLCLTENIFDGFYYGFMCVRFLDKKRKKYIRFCENGSIIITRVDNEINQIIFNIKVRKNNLLKIVKPGYIQTSQHYKQKLRIAMTSNLDHLVDFYVFHLGL